VPTYEYQCTNCHRRYEVVQRFTDPPLETCEACGGKLKRIWNSVGVVLKGSGFYSTDNRSRKALSPSSKDGGSESSSGSEKSDKKPAEKKETKPAAKKDSGSGSGSGGAQAS
jgi:putative FmdB family regulatory protein